MLHNQVVRAVVVVKPVCMKGVKHIAHSPGHITLCGIFVPIQILPYLARTHLKISSFVLCAGPTGQQQGQEEEGAGDSHHQLHGQESGVINSKYISVCICPLIWLKKF